MTSERLSLEGVLARRVAVWGMGAEGLLSLIHIWSSASAASSSASSSSSGQVVVVSTGSYVVNSTVSSSSVSQIQVGDQATITPSGATTPVYGLSLIHI